MALSTVSRTDETSRSKAGLHRHRPLRPHTGPDRADILNLGGFSDAVFNVASSFLESDQARFIRDVEAVEL